MVALDFASVLTLIVVPTLVCSILQDLPDADVPVTRRHITSKPSSCASNPEVLIDARRRFSCGVTDKNNLGVTILGNVVDGPQHEFAMVAIQTQSRFV